MQLPAQPEVHKRLTGEWNTITSTLTWKGKTPNGDFVIEDGWAAADRWQWNLIRRGAAGNVVQTITGTISLAKK